MESYLITRSGQQTDEIDADGDVPALLATLERNAAAEGKAADSEGVTLDRKVAGLHTLSRALLSLVENICTATGTACGHSRSQRANGPIAVQIYAERQRRAKFFPTDLFGEPAWDILLDLFVAAEDNELRSVKSVCISSKVPDATALRYIDQLIAHELVERRPDRTDNRRKFLRLTKKGYRRMVDYLQEMPAIGDEAAELARDLSGAGGD
jgi:DNA-binding MarR family transcriptional regulator